MTNLFLCYLLQPDSFAAITFYPSWIWAIPGTFLALLGLYAYKRIYVVAILGWLIFITTFAEEPKSIVRGYLLSTRNWVSGKAEEKTLRVISLNCAGGNLKAAEEVLQYKPDIVLLQEAPAKKEVELLAFKLFKDSGTIVWNIDTAIIAQGRIEQTPLLSSTRLLMAQTHVWLTSGVAVEVISVHLLPPTIEMNLFSPDCWKKHKEDRKLRRSQLTQIMDQLQLISESVPVIVGGDFNTTAGDGALRILKPRLHDSFQEGGIGWGHTALNNMPLFRVDQIWISRHFKAVSVFSKKTEHSDHRMVICNLKPTQ